jgi:hypothetical protein
MQVSCRRCNLIRLKFQVSGRAKTFPNTSFPLLDNYLARVIQAFSLRGNQPDLMCFNLQPIVTPWSISDRLCSENNVPIAAQRILHASGTGEFSAHLAATGVPAKICLGT